MIPEIKKILHTTDLSENARYAFSYAASLANRYDAGVTIMHVIEDISPTTDNLVVGILGREKWDELRGNNEKEVLATLKSKLTQFCEDVQAELPSCPFITDSVKVTIGKPADEIIKEVDNNDYDMVVMGAHGHGALAEAVMGSVSRRVIRRCKRPVLVVRLPENGKD